MPVVVLGVDSPIGLAIVRDLGRSGFRVTALGRRKQALGLVSRYCHQPLVRAPDGPALREQLLALAADGPRPALLAISETDIAMLNGWRAELGERFVLLFADAQRMALVLDKRVTREHAHAVGMETPASWQIGSLEELQALAGQLEFPVILKWGNPHQAAPALRQAGIPLKKIEYCQDRAALARCLQAYQPAGQYPVIQRYYPGHGLGQFFLCRNGQALMQFQHERLHEWPPEGGSATLCRSVDNRLHQACAEKSRALLRRLNWDGVAMVEYRYDPAGGRYVLMEINGRFWGSTPLSLAAGASFASNLVRSHALNQQIDQPRIKPRYCRYMIPESKRLVRILLQPGKIADPQCRFNRVAEAARFVAFFLHPRCRYYVFTLADPAPFLADMRHVATSAWRLLRGSLPGGQKLRDHG